MKAAFFEAPLLIAGGLLGSAHCLGMCGGFVISVGAAASGWTHNLLRQLVYAAGRVSVYTLAGSVVGFLGWRLELEVQTLVNAQAFLCLLAGTLLILEGCWSLGWLRRPTSGAKVCPMISFGSLLRAPGWGAVFAAGVWNGFLPCGLVYAYLALAASTKSVLLGAAVMVLFGLGTVPSLALFGLTGTLASVAWRSRVLKWAALCLLFMGGWTMVRGITFFNSPETSGCPLCDHSTNTTIDFEP